MNKNSTFSSKDNLNGISCDVCNCVYNKNTKQCHATSIEIGPQYAVNSADTVCATFKKEGQC